MGIFSRFSDIIQSNINAMLDHAEDPQKMVRLMIQEMEDTLIEVRSASARVIADKKTAHRHLQQLQQEADEWERKAKLAVTKNREDLARAALLEKQNIQDECTALEKELLGLDEHLAKLETEISQLQAKLIDAQAKEKAIKMKAQTMQARIDTKQQTTRNKVDDAFARFEGMERRMDRMEGEVEAMDLGSDSNPDLHRQFADLENDDKLNAELDRLKAELKESEPQ